MEARYCPPCRKLGDETACSSCGGETLIARSQGEHDRKTTLGGSEVAAILGLDPYASPVKIWRRKMGDEPEWVPNQRARFGLLLEDDIREEFTTQTGLDVRGNALTFIDPKRPHRSGTPDGEVIQKGLRGWATGFEAKTAGIRMAKEWGEEGTDDVPTPYLLQAIDYADLLRSSMWHVAVVIDFQLKPYLVRVDPELVGMVNTSIDRFWRDYVITGKPPEMDGDKETRLWLEKKYPTTGVLKKASEQEAQLAAEFHDARLNLQAVETIKEKLGNNLRLAIGGHDGLLGPRGEKIYWKPEKPRESVDYKTLFAEVCAFYKLPEDEIARAVAAHTSLQEPRRPLKDYWEPKK